MTTLCRYLSLSITLLCCLLLTACANDEDEQVKVRFYVKNSTEVPVTIASYKFGSPAEKLNSQLINPTDSVLFHSSEGEGPAGLTQDDFTGYFQENTVVDSVYLAYAKEKHYIYLANDPQQRSLLQTSDYTYYGQGNTHTFVFTLSEEDYAAAWDLQ